MKLAARFGRYLIAGGTAAAVDISLFLGLTALGMSYLIAGTISFVLATAVNFHLSANWVFRDRGGINFQRVVATYAVSVVGLGLNQLILWIGVERLLLPLLFAKLLATGIVFFWNFLARNLFVFRHRAPSVES